jgi:spermidine synthase
MPLRRESTVQTPWQKVEIWRSANQCEFRVAGAIHAWWHVWKLLTGLAWDNLAAGTMLHPAGPPKSVLMLGLAGGTTLRILRHLLPECRLVAVDIDPRIVDLARKHMHLEETRVEIHIADAYEWMNSCTDRFDVIIDDVYLAGNEDVYRPGGGNRQHLRTLSSLLNPEGIFLTNLVTGQGHRKTQIETRRAFREHFAEVRSVTTYESMNETLVGGTRLLPPASLRVWSGGFPQKSDQRLWERLRVRRISTLPAR